jgi:hypothetical protein
MKTLQRLVWIGGSFTALACGGVEPMACTDMGCDDGLSVDFSLTEPGDYSIEVIADGESVTCTGTLPLLPCEQGGVSCSAPHVMLGASGCALSEAEHALGGLIIAGAHPASVEVIVSRDGTELGRQTFSPSYVRVAPNGEACGPICEQANVELTASLSP